MRSTSTTRTCDPRRFPRGRARLRAFTLLEVLVVLVIIAVMASMVVANVGGQDRVVGLQIEARRLATLTESALDEVMLSGGMWGLETRDGAYRFLSFDREQQKWLPLERGRFTTVDLDKSAELQLIEPEPRKRATYRRVGSVDIVQPDILILSSGELTPFDIRVVARWDERIAFRVRGEPYGRVRVERLEDDALRL